MDNEGLIEQLRAEHSLPTGGYEQFMATRTPAAADALAKFAKAECERVYGDAVFTRGLIEFTNYCKNDCLYCGIRASNASCRRYRLDRERGILAGANVAMPTCPCLRCAPTTNCTITRSARARRPSKARIRPGWSR